jgi:hypothetical protein
VAHPPTTTNLHIYNQARIQPATSQPADPAQPAAQGLRAGAAAVAAAATRGCDGGERLSSPSPSGPAARRSFPSPLPRFFVVVLPSLTQYATRAPAGRPACGGYEACVGCGAACARGCAGASVTLGVSKDAQRAQEWTNGDYR